MSGMSGGRFTIDAGRLYLTGHSGGARVAMEVALGPNDVAGVIASSAGFPRRQTPAIGASFAVFATAGTEDFNYLELRRLDAALASPHYLHVFDGGHTVAPAAVATEAIEWLEIAAMRARDARSTRRWSTPCSRPIAPGRAATDPPCGCAWRAPWSPTSPACAT